jgi:hypothetical protein
MSTTPRNQDSLTWNAPKPKPREPRPGEVLWSLAKGTETRTAELRTHPHGTEFQVLVNGVLSYGRVHVARSLAEAEGGRVSGRAQKHRLDRAALSRGGRGMRRGCCRE